MRKPEKASALPNFTKLKAQKTFHGETNLTCKKGWKFWEEREKITWRETTVMPRKQETVNLSLTHQRWKTGEKEQIFKYFFNEIIS